MKINKIFGEILLESVSKNYFKDMTGIPDYDAVLFGKQSELPSKYANWVGEIKWMSEKEYFSECSKIQGTSYSDQLRYIIPEKVKSIADKMRGGTRYNLPYLNYVDKSQEGRHRVMAASSLGQDSFPILVLYDGDNGGDNSSSNISDMVGRWKDLVEIGGEYYLRIVDNGNWKRIGRLLSCIVSNYDYYYLDILFEGKRSGRIDINEILFKLMSEGDGALSYIRGDEINYDEYNESKKILAWCVVLRALRNNSMAIGDAVMIRGDSFYLRVLGASDNFGEYDSCESMLLSLVDEGYYVREYNLLSVDEGNELYDISDKDIGVVKGLFGKLNKGN